MANFIDLIYSKEAIQGAKDIHAELSKTHELIIKMSSKSLDFFGGTSPKNPAQMQKVIADFQKIEQSSNKATEALVANAEKQRKAEEKAALAKEKALQKEDALILKQLAAEDKANAKKIAESEKLIKQKEKEFAKFEKDFNKYEADLAKQVIAAEKAKKAKVQALS